MSLPKVSIIILNWNGLADTVECLESLKNITYPNYRVIMVDNASKSNEGAVLKKRFGDFIHLIQNNENLGFAEGNNIGIIHTLEQGAGYVLLLNNDTAFESDFLDELVKTAESDKKIGIVGGKIYYYGTKIIYCLGGGYLNIYTDNYKLIGAKTEDSRAISIETVTKKLGYVSGCCMLIKKEVLNEAGFFDENYFTYCEETDLCLRAKKNGWKMAYADKAVIYHKVARSSKYLSGIYVYYMLRNKLYFMRKHSPTAFFPLYFLTFFLIKNVFGYFVLSVKYGQRRANYPFILKAITDYFNGSLGKFKEKAQ